MAGHEAPPEEKSRAAKAAPERNKRTRRRSAARRVVFGELVRIAADQGNPLPLGVTTADAMQQCLDRAVALWYFAIEKVDAIRMASSDDPDGDSDFWEEELGPGGAVKIVPNRWYVMEQEARKEIEQLAGLMTTLGIAERTVRIEEAKAALMVAAVRDAAIDAGISPDDIHKLGEALRARVEAARTQLKPTGKGASSASRAQSPATSQSVSSLGPGHGPSDRANAGAS